MLGRCASRTVVSLALVLGLTSAAHAQATRTWVSGVGDDANPCSRTAPCQTFAGAISKTADGGFINVIDSGGFGAVTITKSITIDGEAAHAGILASGTNAVVISAPGKRVTLRNLSIESPTAPTTPGLWGVRVLSATEVHLEKVVITGFSSGAVDFQPTGGGEGYFTDVTLINNASGGIHAASGRVMANRLSANSNGDGLVVLGVAIATVRDSYAAGGFIGFGLNGAAAVLNIENSTMTHNSYGIIAQSGGTARVSDCMIVSNTGYGMYNDGTSALISLGGNELIGNPNNGSFSLISPKQ